MAHTVGQCNRKIGKKNVHVYRFPFQRSCGRKVSSLSDLLFLRILPSLSRHLTVSLTLSLPPYSCRAGGPREEWTVRGDDLSLHSSTLLSPSLSALQSSLSTLITYINVSNKKPTLRVGHVCVCRQGESSCACVYVVTPVCM